MSIAGIFALGGGGYGGYEDKDGRYSFGGYYGSKGRGRFGSYNGYNRGDDRCCRRDDNDGLLGFLLG